MKTSILASIIGFVALTSISCKETNQNEPAEPVSGEMYQEEVNKEGEVVKAETQNVSAATILSKYLSIKDALVEDNSDAASNAGDTLIRALDGFDTSQYPESVKGELKDIVMNAKEQAKGIAFGEMEDQRIFFKKLSKHITEMAAITETDRKLYEQFCPMYDEGSSWLSASNEIRNPYYGSKMLKCGKIQREIN